jgi:hypothetical protein
MCRPEGLRFGDDDDKGFMPFSIKNKGPLRGP